MESRRHKMARSLQLVQIISIISSTIINEIDRNRLLIDLLFVKKLNVPERLVKKMKNF